MRTSMLALLAHLAQVCHDSRSIRLGRLQNGGPLLVDHDPTDIIGVIESVEIGQDRIGRAHARRLAENVNAGIQPLQNLSVLRKVKTELGHDSDAWALHFIRKGLEALEAEAQGVGGRFMVGDAFSIADVCLLPQLYNARRFGASLEGLDTLLRVEAACEALPGLAAAHPDRQIDAPKE